MKLIKAIYATLAWAAALMIFLIFGGLDAETINLIPGVMMALSFVGIAGIFARLAGATTYERNARK